jgi:hypothetical protein
MKQRRTQLSGFANDWFRNSWYTVGDLSSPLDFYSEVIWDLLMSDRFLAWVDGGRRGAHRPHRETCDVT